MSVPALNVEEIADVKKTASVFSMSVADFARNAMREYIERKKQEPLYRFTANVEEASPEESAEILAMIDSMTEDDWETVRVDNFIPLR